MERQQQLLAEVFAGEAWEVPRLLEKMQTAPDLYFDAVGQIRMQRWSHRNKKGWSKCQVPGSCNAFVPVDANALEPTACGDCAGGNRDLARISQLAKQDKGLWVWSPGVLTKAKV